MTPIPRIAVQIGTRSSVNVLMGDFLPKVRPATPASRFRATSFDRCVRKATIGATAHDARHDDKSCGKNEEIDDDVPDKGDKYVPARERGSNRIRGTEQAV